ncbi:MAG: branched-chain amino acid ABC transporter ATP-binding protein/permease [Rubrivivax sp.]
MSASGQNDKRGAGLSAAAARRLGIAAIGLGAAVLLSPAFVNTGTYWIVVVSQAVFTTIVVAAMTVLAGSSGIWSLAHASFAAIGAYLTANLSGAGWPLEAIVPACALCGAAVGYLLGLSAGRFSTLYFGLLTLAVSMTVSEIIGRLDRYTGGDQGMAVPPVKSLLAGGLPLTDKHGAALGLVLATLVFLVLDFVIKGARGRRWRAIKSQRMASMSIGLVPHRENAMAFAMSAALAAIGGVASSIAIGYLDPNEFGLERSVVLLAGSVVGGIGSVAGAIFGGTFVAVVPELARGLRDVAVFAFGTSMILVLLFIPRGVLPSVLHLLRLRSRTRAEAQRQATVREAASSEQIAQLARELLPTADADLAVRDLGVRFGGLKALDGVSLTVPPGSVLGLIGPNGAGKTTLLNVLSGYVQPSSCAELRFGSTGLAGRPAYERQRLGFGRTFQHAELFEELTVRETLLLAASRGHATGPRTGPRGAMQDEAVADRILRGLHLEKYADAHPPELPFGIQKVVDVGRMLATRPQAVALDEPFSGLDSDEAEQLRAILRGMKLAGVTVIIIDHAVQEVLGIADHVVVLDFGKVLAAGTPREIQANPEVLAAYFGKSAGKVAAAAADAAAREQTHA